MNRPALGIIVLAAACGGGVSPSEPDPGEPDDAPRIVIEDDFHSICGNLPVAPLDSLDAARAFLAGETVPFRGWEACSGVLPCPAEAMGLAFDAAATTLSCGQNFHAGFEVQATFPITLVEVAAGAYAIDIEQPDRSIRRVSIQARGSVAMGRELLLIDQTQAQTVLRPLAPLP